MTAKPNQTSPARIVELQGKYLAQTLLPSEGQELGQIVLKLATVAASRHPAGMSFSFEDDVQIASVGVLEKLKGAKLEPGSNPASYLISAGVGAISAFREKEARSKLGEALLSDSASNLEQPDSKAQALRGFLRLR